MISSPSYTKGIAQKSVGNKRCMDTGSRDLVSIPHPSSFFYAIKSTDMVCGTIKKLHDLKKHGMIQLRKGVLHE